MTGTGAAENGPWVLSGLRVIDVSHDVAGAYCAKLLTDAGADVVHVEPPEGDALRRWRTTGDETGALFQYLRASQVSTVVDFAGPGAAGAVRALVARAHVLVADDLVTLEACGTGVDALLAANPALVVVTITPWGASGPYARRAATEFTLQAAAGSTYTRGFPDREPVSVGGCFGEWVAGTYAATGALSAWMHAARTGQGQHVDVSMFEALYVTMNSGSSNLGQQWEPTVRVPRSTEVPGIEPASDGWVGFCTQTAQQWLDFCAMVGRPDFAEDESIRRGPARMARRDDIYAAVHAWTRTQTVDEICELASLFRVPATPVGNGESVLSMSQFVERQVFVPSRHGFLQARIPYELHGRPSRPFGLAPSVGEGAGHAQAWDEPAAPPPVPTARNRPLDGVRVLDLTAFWAGPYATMFLGALGADVVKVESLRRPDMMRFGGSVRTGDEAWEWSIVYGGANNSKRDVTLDLGAEPGASLVRDLVRWADVVIENMSPRVLDNFGLGWDDVHLLNPRAVMVRMPAFGLDGPWRDRTGWAMTVEQTSGLAWVTGYDEQPLVPRGPCDPVGGMHAVFATLLALLDREHTGEGVLVEVPLVETALNIAAEQVIEWSAHGVLLGREGNRGRAAAPQGVYRCAGEDSWVAIAVRDDVQWQALCALIGTDAGAVSTEAERRAAHDRIDDAITAWTLQHTASDVEDMLTGAGVPAAELVNPRAVLPHPQLEHRGFLQYFDHPVTGRTGYAGFPLVFSAWGPHLHRSAPPTFGQHNAEVLEGVLGLSAADVAALRAAGAIGERPLGV